MKKLIILISFIAASLPLFAQIDNPVIPKKETVVVDNFTAVPNLSLGLYQYSRAVVLKALSERRLNVINVEDYGYGRPDIVYPSLKFAPSNEGSPFDLARAQNILEDFDNARYYISIYISKFNCHPVDHESKDKEGKVTVKTDFSSSIEAKLYLYDAETGRAQTLTWSVSRTGNSDVERAERYAIEDLSPKVRSFVTTNFPFKASVIKLGEYNKKGKLQDLYLSCGSDMDVERGDIFYLFEVSDINGISSARKLGKVKVKEITGPISCRCSVSNGEAEINTAFLNQSSVIAISDNDRWW